MSDNINEALSRLSGACAGARPGSTFAADVQAVLGDHARLQARVAELEAAPAIDLEQFRPALEHALLSIMSEGRREEIDRLLALIDGSKAPHPDDAAVDAFAAALKGKLANARAKGRGGWNGDEPGMQQRLSDMLREHVAKGDPRDVAAFCMFLHQRGEGIAPGGDSREGEHPAGTPMMPAGRFYDGCWKLLPEQIQHHGRMLTQSWRAADSTELKAALEAGVLALFGASKAGQARSIERPANCRERLRIEGRPYPKSGCAHCKTGGMTGCPYESAVHQDGEVQP